MNILAKLERKIGWLAIGNLPVYVVSAQGMIFIWSLFNPGQLHMLSLNPVAVFSQGEFWRILTFLFIVPIQNPIFAFFYLYLLYIYGSALESEWGSFPFTLFYLLGALGTIASSLLFGSVGGSFYINITIFLAFAAVHPDFVLYLFFFLPVKIKWLGWLTWVGLIYSFLIGPFAMKMVILVSTLNYFLFFSKRHIGNIKETIERIKHRQRFKDWKN